MLMISEREKRQIPCYPATKTLGVSVRVALQLKFSQHLSWWYAEACYMCRQESHMPSSDPTSPKMSVCSLCNSRICPRHRLLYARNWEDTHLLGGIQASCSDTAPPLKKHVSKYFPC